MPNEMLDVFNLPFLDNYILCEINVIEDVSFGQHGLSPVVALAVWA